MQPVPSPRITIEILRGRATQKSRVMTGPTLLIGSDPRCDVQMRSPNVAPKHCLITRQDGVVRATRLSADHAVLHNGKPTAEEALDDGDRLGIGPFEFRIRIGGESPSNAPAALPLEPSTVHRPRFALLDRKPPTKAVFDPPRFNETEAATTKAVETIGRDPEPDDRDERLQDWARRLEIQEAEVGRTRDELAATLEDCQRRRLTLENRRLKVLALRSKYREEAKVQRGRFAALLGDWERRTKLLDEREANVESREARWRRLAEEIDARQSAVEIREREAQEALAALEYRRVALEKERSLLDKEWQRLFAKQQDVADRQANLDRQAKSVAAEEVLLASARKRVDVRGGTGAVAGCDDGEAVRGESTRRRCVSRVANGSSTSGRIRWRNPTARFATANAN